MNVVSRAIGQHLGVLSIPALPMAKRPGLRIFLLALAIFASAFGIIVVKDINRRLFIRYQTLQAQHEKQFEAWGQLSLEQSTLSTPSRVQRIAKNRLLMEQTNPKDVIILSD